jgi:hypothetical protein
VITNVRFSRAPEAMQRAGMLGWVRCVFAGVLELDGLSLRRTARGELRVSFPTRIDKGRREHTIIRPVGDGVQAAIEKQVIAAIDFEAEGVL